MRLDSDGTPVFMCLCDCGTITNVKVVALWDELSSTLEFAYTCEECLRPNWMTIIRQEYATD